MIKILWLHACLSADAASGKMTAVGKALMLTAVCRAVREQRQANEPGEAC